MAIYIRIPVSKYDLIQLIGLNFNIIEKVIISKLAEPYGVLRASPTSGIGEIRLNKAQIAFLVYLEDYTDAYGPLYIKTSADAVVTVELISTDVQIDADYDPVIYLKLEEITAILFELNLIEQVTSENDNYYCIVLTKKGIETTRSINAALNAIIHTFEKNSVNKDKEPLVQITPTDIVQARRIKKEKFFNLFPTNDLQSKKQQTEKAPEKDPVKERFSRIFDWDD